jgi:protein gp37
VSSTNTTIEWCDYTWNFIRGCRVVSAGCDNCYAQRLALRFSGEGGSYEGLARMVNGKPRWTGKLKVVEKDLSAPLKWKKPGRVFVNSMSDLFYEEVEPLLVARAFNLMAKCPHLDFQILTKRPQRMLQVLKAYQKTLDYTDEQWIATWPNVWLGVSVENQQAADERIPLLLQAPAAIRFLSCEPLLSPINLAQAYPCGYYCDEGGGEFGHHDHPFFTPGIASQIHWVITGAESGPGARPMNEDWVRSLRDQCNLAGVAFFYKQNAHNGHKLPVPMLDDRQWLEFPETRKAALA